MDVRVRLVEPDDAARLAGLLQENRDFLAPWEPIRPESYATVPGQLARIEESLGEHERGTKLPCVIEADGEVVGQVNVNDIVRGAFQSAHLGYWVAQAVNGRGVATAAVAQTIALAFGDVGLHRLQASTAEHNVASQTVLARNGFSRIGYAPEYLLIAGRWQGSVLFQLVNDAWTPGS